MYNNQIFLLVAIKLLGMDPNGEMENTKEHLICGKIVKKAAVGEIFGRMGLGCS